MAIGLKVKTNIDSLKKLQEYIEYVQKLATLKIDREFQKYIQERFLEVVNQKSVSLLKNNELTQEYIKHNQIRELDDGFVLYNDTTVETDSDGYGGQFSIALAFEYGTGIVGQENPKLGAWQYNINQHEKGWTYFKNGKFHFTRGFEGYEIYRFTKEEIERQLPNWIKEYKKKDGGVSQ